MIHTPAAVNTTTDASADASGDADDILGNVERQASYIEQMQQMIDSVLEEERHLFNEGQLAHIAAYCSLSDAAKVVFFRLIARKSSKYERVSRVRVPDHFEPRAIIEELAEANLVHLGGPATFSDHLDLLFKGELDEIAKQYQIRSGNQTVEALRSSILKAVKGQRRLMTGAAKHRRGTEELLIASAERYLGQLFRISQFARNTFHRLIVIHDRMSAWPRSGNFLLDSILTNVPKDSSSRRNFPKYKVYRTAIIWPTKQDFDRFLEAIELELELDMLLEDEASEASQNTFVCKATSLLVPWQQYVSQRPVHVTGIPWFMNFTWGHVHTRIIEKLAKVLVNLKHFEKAAQVFEALVDQRSFLMHRRGAWYDELVKIQDNYISKQAARKRPVAIKVFSGTTSGKATYLNDQKRDVSVEELALQYFDRLGWKGMHAENSIVGTLFGVLFWDIMFDDTIPGVFSSPYQSSPLDLFSPHFFESRRTAIQDRARIIENGDFEDIIRAVVAREQPRNTCCIGVNWSRFSANDLVEIAQCIGGLGLAKIMLLFAKTYWLHRGGVPDLCLWKPAECQFKFVEVKGEGDRLSERQAVWIQSLISFGIRAEMFHVKVSKCISRQEADEQRMQKEQNKA
eukprot:jgi/Hompol1/4471/HPOL_001730-RA